MVDALNDTMGRPVLEGLQHLAQPSPDGCYRVRVQRLRCDQPVQQTEQGIRPVLGLKSCSEGYLRVVHQGQFGGDGFDFSELLNLRIGQLLLRFR